MRLKTAYILAVGLLVVPVMLAAGQGLPANATAPAAQATGATAAPESIFEVSYLLTWEKDPRFRGRDPFETVLHDAGESSARRADKIVTPRTPSEEAAFAEKADSLLQEAVGALGESDFKVTDEKLEVLRQMVGIPMVTQVAKEKMADVSKRLAVLDEQYGKVRARAALAQALQLAARMQTYFEMERYGDVMGAYAELDALNTDNGLKNAEVSQTATEVMLKCGELKRRAEIHLEFAKTNTKLHAVSYFPKGRSFAIVNGEVYGEGAVLAPEWTLAAVSGDKVVFDYKGEKISQGLAVSEDERPEGKAARRVR